ncbi:hypothetical protein DPMN_091108 [Dreissena polymorpha]|uniref:Uncharacterized protein n=1 Tax=Dreissena polymorpha TaxID=45954 RepID=A0A9D4QZP3_DREPO|nr:hypothetical protein DPMN_091108 [Dreissena polymorpha]
MLCTAAISSEFENQDSNEPVLQIFWDLRALCCPHQGEAVLVPRVPQGIQPEGEPQEALLGLASQWHLENHVRTHTDVVRENIQCEGKLEGSPGDSRWRGQSTDDVIM